MTIKESLFPKGLTRRRFLKTTSTALVSGAVLGSLPLKHVAALPNSENIGLQTSALEATKQRLLDGWDYHKGSLGGIWEVWRKSAYDANVWPPVRLPHCFNASDAVDPDTAYYQGPGWYRTKLKIENPHASGRTLLHFEGAGQKTEVYVHTEKVGSHVGGYDEFTVDLTDAAARFLKRPVEKDAKDPGLIPVAVMCDNTRDLEMIPSNLSDFNLYGGVYRYLNLVYVPAISIERVHVLTVMGPQGQASVTVRGRLYNPGSLSDQLQLNVQVLDPNGKEISSVSKNLAPWTGEQELISFNLKQPTLWSPRSPSLYRCIVTLKSAHGEHRVIERFGLRSYEFLAHGPFRLNGARLLIRGTQRHEDHAGLGAAMTEDLIRREFGLIKAMGANYVRLAHYQQSRIVLDLCDELGLMVWEELPWCRGGLGGKNYQDQARRMLTNMIDQHQNHPSIILWSLGNENDAPGDFEEIDKNKIRAFLGELNDLAHRLDPSRKTSIRRCEFASDIVDVYSPSIWAGWYRGRYTEYKTLSTEEMKKVNHFIHMEWGGDNHARRHSESVDRVLAKYVAGEVPGKEGLDFLLTGGIAKASTDGDWSETYICNLFDWHLKEQETMDWLTGTAQWAFKDFSTPQRPTNPVPRVNQKGLIERDHTIKEGYYVFQSYWADKPMVHIYGHSWPIRWGEPGESKLVKIYSNCPQVELFLNGASVGTRKRSSQDFPAAGLHWLVQFRKGENELRAVGSKDGKEVADTIKFAYQTEGWGQPAKLTLQKIKESGGVQTIEVRLLDQNNRQCLEARNVVRFALIGDGRLLDNLGTSTGARQIELYNGLAEISLERKGECVVSVSSEGIKTSFLRL
jgi:beta-galactosidase